MSTNNRCPYCGGGLDPASCERSRPDTHTLKKCEVCSKYCISHDNGRVYPMFDNEDPESDPVIKRM